MLALLSLAACSWNRFDELSDRALAREITNAADNRSVSFGDALVGLPRPHKDPGTMLVALGNGDAGITTATITAAGTANTSGTNRETMQLLGGPQQLRSLAPGGFHGPDPTVPLVYVSDAQNTIWLLDPIQFKAPYVPPFVLRYQPSWFGLAPDKLGLALATTDLGSGKDGPDLVAGAQDALVLMRIQGLSLIKARVLAGSNWGTGACTALATGLLGDPGVPVVAGGSPAENVVRVLLDPSGCLEKEKEACTIRELKAPAGALGFGSALLIASFELSSGTQLLVGAPGSGQVFVYNFRQKDLTFDSAPVRTISAPTGAGLFGSALAYGPIITDKPQLIIGAPAAIVDDVLDAGAVYILDRGTIQGARATLATAEANRRLGAVLGLLPFLRPGETVPKPILAAAGGHAVYVFFGGLMADHHDVRVR